MGGKSMVGFRRILPFAALCGSLGLGIVAQERSPTRFEARQCCAVDQYVIESMGAYRVKGITQRGTINAS